MIRLQPGDFVYSNTEFEQMKDGIRIIRSASAPGMLSGFVFGILDASGQVDLSKSSELATLAKPLPCTFHRAFDETKDLDKALSGGAADAAAGAEMLGQLVEKAKGGIAIMPGGGVRSSNIELLKEKTKAKWHHSSAVVGDEINAREIRLLKGSHLTK